MLTIIIDKEISKVNGVPEAQKTRAEITPNNDITDAVMNRSSQRHLEIARSLADQLNADIETGYMARGVEGARFLYLGFSKHGKLIGFMPLKRTFFGIQMDDHFSDSYQSIDERSSLQRLYYFGERIPKSGYFPFQETKTMIPWRAHLIQIQENGAE